MTPDGLKRLAVLLTGHQGSESLNRLAKQLVVGSAREKGFVDQQNNDMNAVYELPYVRLGHFNVLTRFSFLSDSGRFKWDFGGGITEGKALSGFASSKGRSSVWVGKGAGKHWNELGITGVVLVGFMYSDVEFYYIPKDEFLALDTDRLSYKADSPIIAEWKSKWEKTVFQPTFESLLGR
jgi:hypothetical protein